MVLSFEISFIENELESFRIYSRDDDILEINKLAIICLISSLTRTVRLKGLLAIVFMPDSVLLL